jgi:hypothetical protein
VFAAIAGTASAGAETLVFGPGPEQTFVVPAGVTHIKVTAVGEKGQDNCLFGTCFTGFSERVSATLTVTPGEKLYADFTGTGGGAGRGGNAADLRTVAHTEAGSLASRLVVAGGGGGEGESEEGNFPGQGGNAGATEGAPGNPTNPASGGGGGGGTQSKGGAGGTAGGGTEGEAGQLGQGGHGGTGSPAGNAGGGGGGYYGGGGGGSGSFAGAGGGGGSSFLAAGAEEGSFALNSGEDPAGVTVTYAGGTETIPFNASGSEQSFVVPVGVSHIKVVAIGANGQDACGCGAGMGVRVNASLSVKHGQQFFIDFVGGGSSNAGSGGFAADLRGISRTQPGSLESRDVVAGGGGGSGIDEENSIGGAGGNAGFTEGSSGGGGLTSAGGGGGTQKNGGAGGKGEANGENGQLGQGGKGGSDPEGDGGGGGGGYYGGGGGGGGLGGSAGGGGGSSFVVAGAAEVSASLNAAKEKSSLSIIYKSAAPPSVSVVTPPEGARYTKGQSVTASFSCTEGAEGPGLLAGTEGCSGTVANGAVIDTSTAGEHHFTVLATSQDGLTTSKTVTYTVASSPSVAITTPAEGGVYGQGETVDAAYTCTEGAGGPGLKPGSEGCGGTVGKGEPIDTSTGGAHEFTVVATSQDGLSTSKTVKYTVTAPPTVSITTPAQGAQYDEGEVIDAAYSCSEGPGGPGLKPGSEGCSGPVADGAAIDTTPGEHEFTVTAHSADGLSSSASVKYTVLGRPSVSITTPGSGATYLQGQVIDASYSCSEGAFGPGLKPGAEGCNGTVADGDPIDTSTPGEHSFSVTATSTDGQSASGSVTYDVVTAPVFGRCLKAPKGTKGNFANPTCTHSAPGSGKYEWAPGPGPHPGFSLAKKASSPIALETTGGKALMCTGAVGGGQITGLKTVGLVLVLTGCTDGGEECSNTGPGGPAVLQLTGTLAWSDKARNKLDLDLVPSGGFQYECFSSGIPNKFVTLEATGILLPVRTNRAVKHVTDFLTARKGKQIPDSLDGQPPLTSQEVRSENGEEETAGAGLRATLAQVYEEVNEINTVD